MPPKRKPQREDEAQPAPPIVLRDRIVDFARVRAGDIDPNPSNFRTHPDTQRAALAGVLAEIGIADALILYRPAATGRLTLIDGELRREFGPDYLWPCLITDLTDEEADKLLAFLDKLASLAEQDDTKLGDLLAGMRVEDSRLGDLLLEMRAESDLMLELRAKLAGATEPRDEKGLSNPRFQIKVVINLPDLAAFEEALLATGQKNRGAALMQICREYLERQRLSL